MKKKKKKKNQKNRIATHFGDAFWHQTLHFSSGKLTFITFLLFTALFIVTLSNGIITERLAHVALSISNLHELNGDDGPKSTTSSFWTLHRRRTKSVIEKREKERKVWETEKDRERKIHGNKILILHFLTFSHPAAEHNLGPNAKCTLHLALL